MNKGLLSERIKGRDQKVHTHTIFGVHLYYQTCGMHASFPQDLPGAKSCARYNKDQDTFSLCDAHSHRLPTIKHVCSTQLLLFERNFPRRQESRNEKSDLIISRESLGQIEVILNYLASRCRHLSVIALTKYRVLCSTFSSFFVP